MAGKDSTVTIRIPKEGIVRLNNSVNGNPRYRIAGIVDPGTPHAEFREYVTMADAGFVYGIKNGWISKRYRRAELTLTPAGRVRDLRYLD